MGHFESSSSSAALNVWFQDFLEFCKEKLHFFLRKQNYKEKKKREAVKLSPLLSISDLGCVESFQCVVF